MEGFVEGTGGAFSFALLGEEQVTEAESDMFFYGLMYDINLLELKDQYSAMRNKSINKKNYYYYNAILENIDRERDWIISKVRPIFE
ncbi:MAG: hypothetical protein N4A50_01475 [Vallitalea sp.]|jgi:hypothetical protein|nr:hypothetical protein [Vallitalea sp.]